MWEFHPSDVTSIGAYPENGRMHEVIVSVIRHFDVTEGTSGFKELNERLSRELETEIGVDVEKCTSPSGIVLWPPHLAGNPLWEFFIIERADFLRKSRRTLQMLCGNSAGPSAERWHEAQKLTHQLSFRNR